MSCLSDSCNQIRLKLLVLAPCNYGYSHKFVHFSSILIRDKSVLMETQLFKWLFPCIAGAVNDIS
jgi:hypothetical protein